MIVTLPLRLTESGNPGYRIPNSVSIIYRDGTMLTNVNIIDDSITIMPFFMVRSSGYDANNNRITNIVGFDGNSLLKYCPSCGATKPTTEFGYTGRVTTSRRDQSECSDCRSSY
ncbi:hypothetical protein GNF85_15535 [Clostridium perfringens]